MLFIVIAKHAILEEIVPNMTYNVFGGTLNFTTTILILMTG